MDTHIHNISSSTENSVRPWGSYQVIDQGERHKVKKIIVTPGARLSLQMHHHRAEHWVVVSGSGVVARDDSETLVREGETIHLPLGCVHRVSNPGKIPLTFIEVQIGSYLEEDDIVRFSDDYGRAA
jgi:mannose-6-phosphate isomerase-like protein (cupin superfamily)